MQPIEPTGSFFPSEAFSGQPTSQVAAHMSAFLGKADMPFCTAHVCCGARDDGRQR
jgi:hypothetical protein